jgi:hypothetical protein
VPTGNFTLIFPFSTPPPPCSLLTPSEHDDLNQLNQKANSQQSDAAK